MNQQLGDYQLLRVIGRGGMGMVYEAQHVRLDRRVALKVLPPELAGSEDFRTRFRAEASTLARLASPHIIQVYDHGEHDGALYLATQLVAGGDLGDLLERNGPLPPERAVELAVQVCSAVADAHDAGVLHRDIKPNNVLLAGSGGEPFAYLCDFGIARLEDADTSITGTGNVIGTWPYLAPERAEGAPASRATDVYALGCLIWTMLTGSPPYAGTAFAVMLSHQRDPVRQLPGTDPLSVALNRVLARTMAKAPRDRYQDAHELAADLRATRSLARGRPPVAPPRPPPPPPMSPPVHEAPTDSTPRTWPQPTEPPRRRRVWVPVVAAAAVLALAAGTGALLALTEDDPQRASPSSATTDGSPATSTGEPPTTTPTTFPEPEPTTVTVINSCGPGGTGDCFVTKRSRPTDESTAHGRYSEGDTLEVTCEVRGKEITNRQSGRVSDVWAYTTEGYYVSAAFLTGIPYDRPARPC